MQRTRGAFSQGVPGHAGAGFTNHSPAGFVRFVLRCLCSDVNLSLLIVFAVAAAVWKREYCWDVCVYPKDFAQSVVDLEFY